MTANALPRKFKLNVNPHAVLLDDPNPNLSLDEVKNHFSVLYPEIASGNFGSPKIENDTQVFTISGKTVGVKG